MIAAYGRIAHALSFYRDLGFVWIDTPWVVSGEATGVTCKSPNEECHGGFLVGSAEQGFIQLAQHGVLRAGRYVSAGPCFRFGDAGQPGKHPYFFKVELLIADSNDHRSLREAAELFMQQYTTVQAVSTADGEDLEANGIEVGSYGSRQHASLPYPISYGTGLAEPRFSEAMALR